LRKPTPMRSQSGGLLPVASRRPVTTSQMAGPPSVDSSTRYLPSAEKVSPPDLASGARLVSRRLPWAKSHSCSFRTSPLRSDRARVFLSGEKATASTSPHVSRRLYSLPVFRSHSCTVRAMFWPVPHTARYLLSADRLRLIHPLCIGSRLASSLPDLASW